MMKLTCTAFLIDRRSSRQGVGDVLLTPTPPRATSSSARPPRLADACRRPRDEPISPAAASWESPHRASCATEEVLLAVRIEGPGGDRRSSRSQMPALGDVSESEMRHVQHGREVRLLQRRRRRAPPGEAEQACGRRARRPVEETSARCCGSARDQRLRRARRWSGRRDCSPGPGAPETAATFKAIPRARDFARAPRRASSPVVVSNTVAQATTTLRPYARAPLGSTSVVSVDHQNVRRHQDEKFPMPPHRRVEACARTASRSTGVRGSFMRLRDACSSTFFRMRICVNVHLALPCPPFPESMHQRQTAHRVRGVITSSGLHAVHFVVIAAEPDSTHGIRSSRQGAVHMLPGTTKPRSPARILAEEHRLLPPRSLQCGDGGRTRVSVEVSAARGHRRRPIPARTLRVPAGTW